MQAIESARRPRARHRSAPARLLGASAVAAVVAVGCTVGQDDSLAGSTQQRIVNGAPELEGPFVAALGDERSGAAEGFCTATVITDRLLLSAAHCGANMPADYVESDLRAFFGADISAYERAEGIDAWHIHPSYEPSPPAGEGKPYDFSVLVLTSPVPIEPARIHFGPMDDALVASGVTSVGFGCTTWGGGEFGQKSSAALTVDTVQELFLLSVTDTNPSQANICAGDSGGGMFLARSSDWVQIGVHSEGLAFMGGVPVVTVSGRVDVAATWLRDRLEAVHGERDICQINGWYDDGVCDDSCELSDPDCDLPVDAGPDADASAGGGPPEVPPDAPAGEEQPGCQCTAGPAGTTASLGWMLGAWLLGLLRLIPRD